MKKKKERRLIPSSYHLRNYNFKLVLYALTLSIIGIVVVQSASVNETQAGMFSTVQKQIMGVALGIIAMIILSLVDYHKLLKLSIPIYLVNIALLIYVRFGTSYSFMGAKRWIYVPGFGTVQPSEFSKLALVIMGAWLLGKLQKKINNVFVLILYLAVMGVTAVLILIEPNLSTTLEILFGIAAMLFLANISWKWITGVLAVFAAVIGIILFAVYQPEQTLLNQLVEKNIVQDYQVDRINAYFFPDEYPDLTRQQLNSVMAIGGGQLYGKGLNTSTLESVKNGGFLSEEQSDFIFAVVGEELGFVGCMFLILLYVLIMIEGLRIAGRSPDFEGRVIAGGLISIFIFQCFVNMGVATLLLPNTGTPLQFISAGMSSLLGSFCTIGILLNIGLHKKRNILMEGTL